VWGTDFIVELTVSSTGLDVEKNVSFTIEIVCCAVCNQYLTFSATGQQVRQSDCSSL